EGVGELEARVVDGNREPDRSLRRKRDRGSKREAEAPVRIVAFAAEDGQRSPGRLVPAEGEAMEFGSVVIGGQARAMLEGMGEEVELGLGAIDEMLLPARDERLLEPGADRFTRIYAQPAGTGGKRKDALWMRRSEPLEIEREAALRRERIGMAGSLRLWRRGVRRLDLDRGNLASVGEIEPAVPAPHAFLDGGLAPERRAFEALERPRAKVRVIDLAIRRLDNLSVSGTLERGVRRILRGQEMDVRVQFIRAFDVARPRHRDRVIVAGAALGRGQIVPAAALEEMRAFDEPMRAAGENVLR